MTGTKVNVNNKAPNKANPKVYANGGEHLPFHFLEGKDRYQRSDNNEFGEKHGAGFLFGRLPDKPHFRHQVESRHPHFFGFPVKCHEYPFHHDDRPIDNNTEVYGSHGEQVGRHAHDP